MINAFMLVASHVFVVESLKTCLYITLEIFEKISRFFGYLSHFTKTKSNFWNLLEILSQVVNILFRFFMSKSFSRVFLKNFRSLQTFCGLKPLSYILKNKLKSETT